MSQKPGVMVYFEMSKVIEPISDADAGKLFRAILAYGETLQVPELPDKLICAWPLIQQKIDADDQRYYNVSTARSYAAYVRWQEDRGLECLSKEEWLKQQQKEALETLCNTQQ